MMSLAHKAQRKMVTQQPPFHPSHNKRRATDGHIHIKEDCIVHSHGEKRIHLNSWTYFLPSLCTTISGPPSHLATMYIYNTYTAYWHAKNCSHKPCTQDMHTRHAHIHTHTRTSTRTHSPCMPSIAKHRLQTRTCAGPNCAHAYACACVHACVQQVCYMPILCKQFGVTLLQIKFKPGLQTRTALSLGCSTSYLCNTAAAVASVVGGDGTCTANLSRHVVFTKI